MYILAGLHRAHSFQVTWSLPHTDHSFPAWTEKGVLGKSACELGVLTPSRPHPCRLLGVLSILCPFSSSSDAQRISSLHFTLPPLPLFSVPVLPRKMYFQFIGLRPFAGTLPTKRSCFSPMSTDSGVRKLIRNNLVPKEKPG